MQELVGYKVLTLLKFDVESFRSVRIFSSEPSYPIGGIKQHPRHSAWSEHIVDRCIPFVAVTLEDVRRTFPDHAGIEAVGCGSTLSVPIVHRGQPKGTLNLWHVSGFTDQPAPGQSFPLHRFSFPFVFVKTCPLGLCQSRGVQSAGSFPSALLGGGTHMVAVQRLARVFGVALACALAVSGSQAQSWPTQSVRIIVGFAPGGTADILARKLQAPLSIRLGQPIIIENRPGASGAIATAEVVKATDAHTFALVVSTHASLPAINRKLPYDTLRDITPISFIGRNPLILVVKLGLPAKTLPELVSLAKERPGGLNYAHPGIGLSHHFAGELLKQRAGINIMPVAYRGAAPALTDVIANQIDMTFATTPSVRDPVESGLVRALASTGSQRSMPSIPTFAEVGFEGFDVSEWYGIVGPASTPPAVVARLTAEINQALDDPQLQDWLRANALQRGATTPEGFREFVAKEIERAKMIAETAKISVE